LVKRKLRYPILTIIALTAASLMMRADHTQRVQSEEQEPTGMQVLLHLAESRGLQGIVTRVPSTGVLAAMNGRDLAHIAEQAPARFWASGADLVCQLPGEEIVPGYGLWVLKPWQTCMAFVNSLPREQTLHLRSGGALLIDAWTPEQEKSLYFSLYPDMPFFREAMRRLPDYTGAEMEYGERVGLMFGVLVRIYTTPRINRSASIAPPIMPILLEEDKEKLTAIPLSPPANVPASWPQEGSAGPLIRNASGGLPALPDLLDKVSVDHRKVMRSAMMPSAGGSMIALGDLVKQMGQSASLPMTVDKRLASMPMFVAHARISVESFLNEVCAASGTEARSVGGTVHLAFRFSRRQPWFGLPRKEAAEFDQLVKELLAPYEPTWPAPARELWKVAKLSHALRPADLSKEIQAYLASLLWVTPEQLRKENCLYVSRTVAWGPIVITPYHSSQGERKRGIWYVRARKMREMW